MNLSPNFPTLNARERGYPAMPAEADGFPDGWVVRRVPRTGKEDKIDSLFYSPTLDLQFRSKAEARRFLDFLTKVDGNDEAAAMRLLKQEQGENCTRALCPNLAVTRGLCRRHGPRCAVEGCDNAIYSRMRCKKHRDVTTTPQKTIIGEVAVAEQASPKKKSSPKGVHDAKHQKKCSENPITKSSRKSINGDVDTIEISEKKSSNNIITEEVQAADSSNISEENVVKIEQEYDQYGVIYGVVDTIGTSEKKSSKYITNKIMDKNKVSAIESVSGVKQEHHHRQHSFIPILHQAASPPRGTHIKFESDSESTTCDDVIMVINNSNGKQQRRNSPQSSIDVIDLTTDSSTSSVVEAEISKIIREKKRVRLGSISKEYKQYYNREFTVKGRKLKKLLKQIPGVVVDEKGRYAIWKEGELNDEEMNATTAVTPTTASPRKDEMKDIQILNHQRDSSTASAVCQADDDRHERRSAVQLCHNEGVASVNAKQPKENQQKHPQNLLLRWMPPSGVHIQFGSGSGDALGLSGTGSMDQITTTNMNQNNDGEPERSNNERRVLLPPEMKAQLVSLIPRKCKQNKGVSEGDILSKIKGFVAACQGVASEDVLKDNFPNNELQIEMLRGKKRYFLRSDCSSRPIVISKKVELEEEHQQQHHHVVVQQEKRSNDATTQGEHHVIEETAEQNPSSNDGTSMVQILTDEKKATILSHIPRKEQRPTGVSFSYIIKKVKSEFFDPWRCGGMPISRREIFEDVLREDLEMEEINGTKRYFLRPVPIFGRDGTEYDANNNVKRNEEPGVQHASITEECAKERENSENSNSYKSCEEMIPMEGTDPPVGETTACTSLESDVVVDSGIITGSSQKKKNRDKKHTTTEKLIELTPGQACETKFPPGCQVVYDFKVKTKKSCKALSMGVVRSVKVSSKGFIYEIKATTLDRREDDDDDGDIMMINERSLAYAPTTLIHFQPNSSHIVQRAGIVLLASRMSDNDAREFRYLVLTPDNGELQHNVVPEQLSFRAISSMSEEVYRPKHPPTAPLAKEEKDKSSTSKKVALAEQKKNKEEISALNIRAVELLEELEGSNAKQRKKMIRRLLRSSNVGSINEEQASECRKGNKNKVADVNSEASARAKKCKKSKRKRTDEKSHQGNQIISPQTQPKEKRRRLTGKNTAHD